MRLTPHKDLDRLTGLFVEMESMLPCDARLGGRSADRFGGSEAGLLRGLDQRLVPVAGGGTAGARRYNPFSQRPALATWPGAALVRVRFRSSRRMATATMPMIPTATPTANRQTARRAIKAAMTGPLVWLPATARPD
jgi:hypothetical protein